MTASSDEHRRLLAEALARADQDIGELRVRVAEGERAAAELAICQGGVRGSCASTWPGSWAR